jgi:hypothetical protein
MFRGELQSPARHCGKHADFADHRGDAGSAQSFLHRPQDLGVAPHPDQHEPAGVEPAPGKAGPVNIRPRQAPQHDPILPEPCQDAGGESGGERAILLVAAHSQDLVQGAARQPAARQGPVDRSDAKGRHPMRRRRRPLDPPNPLAQCCQNLAGHARRTPSVVVSSLFVPDEECCQSRPQKSFRKVPGSSSCRPASIPNPPAAATRPGGARLRPRPRSRRRMTGAPSRRRGAGRNRARG